MASGISKHEVRLDQGLDRATSENGEYNPLAIVTVRGITGKDIRESIFKNLRRSSAEQKAPSKPIQATAADRALAMAQSGHSINQDMGNEIEA